jgi:hypothetical protein
MIIKGKNPFPIRINLRRTNASRTRVTPPPLPRINKFLPDTSFQFQATTSHSNSARNFNK